MVKVSVIVPVYNKSQYLKVCLDSLIHQTLKDIEIICVDDRSIDNSLDILKEYATRDERIVLMTCERNQGVSAARNIGIKRATGEFIAFLDADDFVDLDFYEKLYSAAEGFDCVKGEVWNYDPEINSCTYNYAFDVNKKIRKTNNPIYFFADFTSTIYRRAFVEKYHLHFPEGVSYYEDTYFLISVATRLSAIQIVDEVKYYFRNVETGLSLNPAPSCVEELYRMMMEIFSYLRQCELSFENKYIIANHLFSLTCSMPIEEKMGKNALNHLREEYQSFLKSPEEGKEIKISVIVPVYNGSQYLRRSLDCLTLQSLKEIEIICVNDCSSDNSLCILKEYRQLDNRIKIIDCKENGGESKARNIGIRAATGTYLAFMDQDDRIDLFFYEKLYEKAIQTGNDIIKAEGYDIYYNGQILARPFSPIEENPLYFAGDWWTAIYKRTLIQENHVELPEGYPLGGDLKFLFDACANCDHVATIQDVSYYHLMRPDSGDSEITPLHKMHSVVKIFTEIIHKINKMDLYHRDVECYIFYYYSYIMHVYGRIPRCMESEGKLMCTNFIFELFESCKCKSTILKMMEREAPILEETLKNRQKDFLEQMLLRDALSDVFYENYKKDRSVPSMSVSIIVPYIKPELPEKYIWNNAFLKNEKGIRYCLVDNREENKALSRIYNEFMDRYDYEKDSWLIFMHSDFEFLTYPSAVLENLNPSKIYGPIGTKANRYNGKMFISSTGKVFEKSADNTLLEQNHIQYRSNSVDTLDCMCVMVHSSLVSKYHLRFDENLLFDLYVEDFCINASRQYGISVEAVQFDCVHHSGYFKEKIISKRYLNQLQYLNRKYPDDIYGGTVTPIGGKLLPTMSGVEIKKYNIRQKITNGESNE